MHQVRIEAESRDNTGKGAARSLRRDGKLPAVVYGFGDPARTIQLDAHSFDLALNKQRAEHALINLAVDGGDTSLAIVKSLQRDPVRHHVLHVDFLAIRMDQQITVETEIILDGEPAGVAQGGVLEFVTRTIETRALPQDVPDSMHIDVSALNVGDTLHVRDLAVPDGVTILTDADMLLVTVAIPRIIEEVVAEPVVGEEEAQEPERVGEKDEEAESDDH